MVIAKRIKKIASLTLIALICGLTAYGITDTIRQAKAADSLRLMLPFAEESYWQSWRGDPNKMIPYAVRGLVHLFGTERQKFLYQPGDTWFVYGLHGDTVLSNQPYGPDYEQWQGRHDGIDFITVPGLAVRAAREGEIEFVGERVGQTVIVGHGNGYQTTYGHLDNMLVQKGQQVSQGQIIGYAETNHELPNAASLVHLSYDQVFSDGSVLALNPLRYLDLGNAIVPVAEANQFASNLPIFIGGKVGSDPLADPLAQPDFFWNHQDIR